MTINNNEKIDILKTSLEERYLSIHKIRDRVESVSLWTLGAFVSAGGWLIQSDITLSSTERILSVLGAVMVLVVIRFFYLSDLEIGFKRQLQVASEIEESLGLYTPGIFNDKESPIYPKEWRMSGTPTGGGNYFKSTNSLLYAGTIFLVAVILLKCSPQNFHHRSQSDHFDSTTIFLNR